jgi:ribonuclease E
VLDNEPNDTNTPAETSAEASTAVEAPKKAPRRRATKAAAAPSPEVPAAAETPAAAPAADSGAVTEAPKKAAKKAPAKKAAPRKKAAPKVEASLEVPIGEDEAQDAATAPGFVAPTDDEPLEAPAEPTARRRTRAPAVVVTFQAPEPSVAPARPTKAAPAADNSAEDDESPAPRQRRRAGTAGAMTSAALLSATDPAEAPAVEAEDDEDEDGTGPRRRRRGRRGRGGRPQGETAETEETTSEADGESAEGDEDEDDEEGADGTAAGTRRRRRRRRSTGGGAGAEGDDDDVPTVVHVREPGSRDGNREPREGGGQQRQRQRPPRERDGGGAADEDGVRGIAGSTRMAAKRVRRQEGRDSGRKRAPILTEAEFLARREAVDRQMVVRQKGDRTQIAVLEDGILVEHYVTKASASSYAGNVYLGRVQNVLPSMEAAFVDVGKGRNAVLYAGEVNWDGVSGGGRKIEQVLKSGQEVLVQVSKDPIGHKGARLTSQINLPGRYLVYVPDSSMTGISRKLPENERTRLKNILRNVVPEGAGVIIRTAAEGVSEEEIAKDVRRLQAQWENISSKVAAGGAPKLLHAEPDLVIKVVRDIFNEDFASLVVQGESEWDTIREYVEFVAPDLAPRLKKFAGNGDVFSEHRIDEQLLKALDRKVYLPSGGSLVIDRTEAMVVVDVNTGKYVGKGGNLEETVTRNNLEAAEEIARQLRLRDLGGIIVVDFIDMVLESNRDLVVRRLVECLGRDRTKHQVAEVTSLGLVQMTRKRVGQGLLESFSETCEHCNGRGVKIHMDPTEPRAGRDGGRDNGSDRDRKPQVGPRAPVKPGPQLHEDPTAAPAADAPSEGSGGSRNRRRRGGRGSGSATLQPENELAELLADSPAADAADVAEQAVPAFDSGRIIEIAIIPDDVPVEDALEQAETIALEEPPIVDEPPVVIEDLVVAQIPVPEVVEPAGEPVKKRRRAASRPAGSPSS